MDEFAREAGSEYLPIHVGNETFRVEARLLDEDIEVAGRTFGFEEFGTSVRAVSGAVADAVLAGVGKLKPNKVALEFGCEVGMETGKLTAILVKGTAKANLKVTVEWTPGARPDKPNGV